MLYEGLQTLLASDAGIVALIGDKNSRNDKTSGIFPVSAPEAVTFPFIVIAQVAGSSLNTLDGADDLSGARMQFSCYGSKFLDAKKLARAVKKLMDGLSGVLPDGTQLERCASQMEIDLFEDTPFSFRTELDFQMWFREPIAA